jgi:hypothetical protein
MPTYPENLVKENKRLRNLLAEVIARLEGLQDDLSMPNANAKIDDIIDKISKEVED